MSELAKSIEKLVLQLDRMGLRVEEHVEEALRAADEGNIIAGEEVDESDTAIDREEVAIERECIRLLALYQPTAIDLRTLCFVIKANNDLERIADKAAHIGRRVKHLVAEHIEMRDHPEYRDLVAQTRRSLSRTVRLLSTRDAETAREVIAADRDINRAYRAFVRQVLDDPELRKDVDKCLTMILLGRALERIGDLCTNIAEDIVFLCTGEIVRHAAARKTDTS